eukprot:2804556-Pleurochrysis_carterae.AAC.4
MQASLQAMMSGKIKLWVETKLKDAVPSWLDLLFQRLDFLDAACAFFQRVCDELLQVLWLLLLRQRRNRHTLFPRQANLQPTRTDSGRVSRLKAFREARTRIPHPAAAHTLPVAKEVCGKVGMKDKAMRI